MSGKVLWWHVFPFSICEISILLLLVHRLSWYSSYSLVNIGAAQHNSTLARASRSGLCHSQRLGYPWELRGSTQGQPASLPPAIPLLVLVQVSSPAVSHKRQHHEWSQYPQTRQTQSSVNSSSSDLQECRREAKQALDAVHSAVRCSWVITSPRLCLSCLSP